jgi:hypothetical protein
MSNFSWGGFGAGLARGFEIGERMGDSIDRTIKQKKLNDIRTQGIAEANAMREKAINESVRENGIEAATPATQATTEAPAPVTAPAQPAPSQPQLAEDPMTADQPAPKRPAPIDAALPGSPQPGPAPAPDTPAPTATASLPAAVNPAAQGMSAAKKRYSAFGREFDDRDQALEHARKNAPTMMDFMGKTMVPKMQEALIAQGDIEKAEAWGKWAKERKNQRTMETWANAYTAAQRGDLEGAADGVFQLYKSYDDGVTPISKEVVKDKAGNVTGFNVKLRDDATGEERSQFVGQEQLLSMGMSALSPPALFEQAWKRANEAAKLGAQARIQAQSDARKAAADRENDERTRTREKEADERRHKNRLAEIKRENELQSGRPGETGRTIRDLQAAGWSEEEIRAHVKKNDSSVGKAPHPEAVRLRVSERLRGDTLTKYDDGNGKRVTFDKLTKAEQNRIIDEQSDLGERPTGGTSTTPNPTAQKAPAGVKDGKYWLPDGQGVEVRNGEIIPMQKR